MRFNDIATPTHGATGTGRLYKKSSDDSLFWKPDAAGAEVDLTTSGGGTGDWIFTDADVGLVGTTDIINLNTNTVTIKAVVNLKCNYYNTTSSVNNLRMGNATVAITDTGINNMFIGSDSGLGVVGSSVTKNVFIGENSGRNVTTGNRNVLLGRLAGRNVLQGFANVCIGEYVSTEITNGERNICIGQFSGTTMTTGNDNILIGQFTKVNSPSHSGSIAIGAGTIAAAANTCYIGKSGMSYYIYGTWNNISDSRDKCDIKDTSLGLSFINKLTPRMYQEDPRMAYISRGGSFPQDGNVIRNGVHRGSRYHQGFVAQEVKSVMDELGVDFAGYNDQKICGGPDALYLKYIEFIAPMVKAIQELSAENHAIRNEIELLKTKIV